MVFISHTYSDCVHFPVFTDSLNLLLHLSIASNHRTLDKAIESVQKTIEIYCLRLFLLWNLYGRTGVRRPPNGRPLLPKSFPTYLKSSSPFGYIHWFHIFILPCQVSPSSLCHPSHLLLIAPGSTQSWSVGEECGHLLWLSSELFFGGSHVLNPWPQCLHTCLAVSFNVFKVSYQFIGNISRNLPWNTETSDGSWRFRHQQSCGLKIICLTSPE